MARKGGQNYAFSSDHAPEVLGKTTWKNPPPAPPARALMNESSRCPCAKDLDSQSLLCSDQAHPNGTLLVKTSWRKVIPLLHIGLMKYIHTYVLSNNLVVPMILRIFICIFSIKVHQLAEGAPTPLDPGGEWPGHIPGQVRQSPGQVEPKQGGLPTFWPLATTTTTTRGGLGMSSHCLTTRFMPESIATESQRSSFYKFIRSLMML